MWGIVRRKVVSAGSSALVNGTVQSLERAGPALAGSISRGYAAANPISEALNLGRRLTLLRQFHQGAPVYLGSVRNVVASLKTDSTQMSSRSLSSGSATLKKSGDCEQISQIDTTKGPVENINTLAEKPSNGSISLDEKAGGSFMISAGVYGTLLSSPIVNPPQAAQLGLPSIASPTFLPNLALFGHIHNGVEEILADYVHHEMTRTLIMIIMRLFLIIAAKDVFLLTN